MNQINSGLGGRPAAPVLVPHFSTRGGPMGIDPNRLRDAILAKRAEIAALELEWSSASEQSAARAAGGAARLGERETWDKATWERYLSAASGCQETFLPRLRRLYSQVSQLELLADPLPTNTQKVA